jgi:energy-coupling factor transporter ATP-binding protein EcfA2
METITTNSTTTPADGSAFPPSPFVGLRPFDSDEALLFFGRREQTVELLQQLHHTHFIAVVGSSGCGKSSLVRAGLIPKLKAGFLVEDLDGWRVAVMKPGDGPIRNLAAALLGAVSDGADEQEVERLVEKIEQFGAEAILMRLAPALYDSSNLLLLVDQFEEIFRFGVESGKPQQRAEAEDFVSIMLALAEQRRLPIYVVMTMRSDFLGDCDNFYGLPEAMNRSQYLAPRLTRQQRQQAIEGPIRLFGGAIAPRLLDRVLNDVGDKTDQLPVMQHALMRTWEEWEMGRGGDGATGRGDDPQSAIRNPQSGQVDLPHYEAAGGINDALSKDAEAALDGMSEEELKIAERMFQALTDTDARNRRVRRPAHLSEIVAITGADRETILKIIERFRGGGRSFLTLTKDDDPLIDISHESLIRQWERMSQWVEAEAESREMYRRSHLPQARTEAGLALGRHTIATGSELEKGERTESAMGGALRFGLRFGDGFSGEEPFGGIAQKTYALVCDHRSVYRAARVDLACLATTGRSQASGRECQTARAKGQPILLRRQYESGAGGERETKLHKVT